MQFTSITALLMFFLSESKVRLRQSINIGLQGTHISAAFARSPSAPIPSFTIYNANCRIRIIWAIDYKKKPRFTKQNLKMNDFTKSKM